MGQLNNEVETVKGRTSPFSVSSLKPRKKIRVNWPLFLFILPGLLIYSIFFAGPTVAALVLSFTNWDGISSNLNFIGFDNYVELFTNDPIFIQSLTNNLKFTLSVLIFQTVLSLIFAIMLVKNTKTNVFYRSIFFFPTVVASVSIAFTWNFMYDPNIGVINSTLSAIGLEGLTQSWLGNPDIAIYSIAFIQFWMHTGQMLIIFVAGLHSIPKELYEASSIEGASKWQTFRYVTWPLLAPSATIVVAYTTIQSFKAFDLIIATTNGGPSYATEILSVLLYHEAFNNFRFGYSSTISVVFMIIIAIITVVQFRVLKSNDVKY